MMLSCLPFSPGSLCHRHQVRGRGLLLDSLPTFFDVPRAFPSLLLALRINNQICRGRYVMFGDDSRTRFGFSSFSGHETLFGGGILVDCGTLLRIIQDSEPVATWCCERLWRVRLGIGWMRSLGRNGRGEWGSCGNHYSGWLWGNVGSTRRSRRRGGRGS
jgi:hypothetical protein